MVQYFCFGGNEITALGLLLDIVGVLGLFRYGLPSDLYLEDRVFGGDPEKERKLKFKSQLSLSLILLGFALQIIGLYWNQEICI